MPTYDYACSACGHRFERFEGIHDEGAKECPKCHRKKARRMLGAGAGLIFKGSGFYTTDYKQGGRRTEGAGGAKESKEPKEPKEGDKKEPPKEKKKEEKEHKK